MSRLEKILPEIRGIDVFTRNPNWFQSAWLGCITPLFNTPMIVYHFVIRPLLGLAVILFWLYVACPILGFCGMVTIQNKDNDKG